MESIRKKALIRSVAVELEFAEGQIRQNIRFLKLEENRKRMERACNVISFTIVNNVTVKR